MARRRSASRTSSDNWRASGKVRAMALLLFPLYYSTPSADPPTVSVTIFHAEVIKHADLGVVDRHVGGEQVVLGRDLARLRVEDRGDPTVRVAGVEGQRVAGQAVAQGDRRPREH